MTCDPDPVIARLEHEGRILADLLDSGTVPAEVRASIMGATTSADVAPSRAVRVWSVGARAIIDGIRS